MKKIKLNCKYVQGYLRNGHFELELDNEDFKEFQSLSKEEQLDWIKDGKLIIDSYSVDDYETLKNFEVLNNETN